MNVDSFWEIVDGARARVKDPAGDAHLVAEGVTEHLVMLQPEDIVGFQQVLDELRRRAYRWDLWAAGYVINGGCSDDGFDYFRAWLVAQGRAVFEAAVADADSLADLLDPEDEVVADCEELLNSPVEAFGRVTGDGDLFWQVVGTSRADATAPQEPAGEEFDFEDDDELSRRLPRLFARFFPDEED